MKKFKELSIEDFGNPELVGKLLMRRKNRDCGSPDKFDENYGSYTKKRMERIAKSENSIIIVSEQNDILPNIAELCPSLYSDNLVTDFNKLLKWRIGNMHLSLDLANGRNYHLAKYLEKLGIDPETEVKPAELILIGYTNDFDEEIPSEWTIFTGEFYNDENIRSSRYELKREMEYEPELTIIDRIDATHVFDLTDRQHVKGVRYMGGSAAIAAAVCYRTLNGNAA